MNKPLFRLCAGIAVLAAGSVLPAFATSFHVNLLRGGSPTPWLGTLQLAPDGHGRLAVHAPEEYTGQCNAAGTPIRQIVDRGLLVVALPSGPGGMEALRVRITEVASMRVLTVRHPYCLLQRPRVHETVATVSFNADSRSTQSIPLPGTPFVVNLTPAG